ncbi:MAG: response regulator transcription factor [Anaerolineae bacterium]
MKTRILLVDDHALVRLGLMTLINDQPGMQVIGEAGTSGEAVRAVERMRPDIVLMDIRIPGEGGIEAARQITERFPDTKVVMLTSYADNDLVVRAIRAGAVGYILKQVGNEELLRAIAAAARGEAILDAATTARLLSRVREKERQAEEDAFRDLSEREMQVLAQVARGKTNAQIGLALNLTEKTVRNYLSTVLEKLHLTNRIELATYAVEHHLLDRMGKD